MKKNYRAYQIYEMHGNNIRMPIAKFDYSVTLPLDDF